MSFPTTVYNWGEAFVDNQCQRFTAEEWMAIQNEVTALELATLRVLLTGSPTTIQTGTTTDRPQFWVTSFVATVSGAADLVKTIPLPAVFSSDDLAFFAGTPLASTNSLHLSGYKIQATPGETGGITVSFCTPLAPNGSGQNLEICRLRDFSDSSPTLVNPGDYVITLLITC